MLLWLIIGVAACLFFIPAGMKLLGKRSGAEGSRFDLGSTNAVSPGTDRQPADAVTAPPQRDIAPPPHPSDETEALEVAAADAPDIDTGPSEDAGVSGSASDVRGEENPPAAELRVGSFVLPTNSVWSYGAAGKQPYTTDLRLLPDGRIGGYVNANEHSWRVEDGILTIVSDLGQPTTVFDRVNINAEGRMTLIGQFATGPGAGIEHYLEAIPDPLVSDPPVRSQV